MGISQHSCKIGGLAFRKTRFEAESKLDGCWSRRTDSTNRLLHSYLSATMGSTFVALRAGLYTAKAATAASKPIAPTSVVGSAGLRPKSWLEIRRPAASAMGSPKVTPATINNIDSR